MHSSLVISFVLTLALYLSACAVVRIVQGAVTVAKVGHTKGLMGLTLALGAPALAWGLFYYLVR